MVSNSVEGDILGLTNIIASGTQAVSTVEGVGNADRIEVGERLSVTVSSSAGASDLVLGFKTERKNNP